MIKRTIFPVKKVKRINCLLNLLPEIRKDKENIELSEDREISSKKKGPIQNNVQIFANANKSSHSPSSENNGSLNRTKDNESAIVINNSPILSQSKNDIGISRRKK